VNRAIGYSTKIQINLKRVDLVTKGVSLNGDVKSTECFLPSNSVGNLVGQHDQSCAGSKDGKPGTDSVPDGIEKAISHRQFLHDRGFSAGDYQTSYLIQLL
jgi:hypothetical protein